MNEDEHSEPEPLWRRPVTRRTILVVGGAGAAATLLDNAINQSLTSSIIDSILAPKRFDWVVDVLRPADFLRLRFLFDNLIPDTNAPPSGPRLVQLIPNRTSFVVVQFPPQHVVEQALVETLQPPSSEPAPNDGFWGRLANDSQLAFEIPKTTTQLPYTLDALLDWLPFVPKLVPVADPVYRIGKPPKARKPGVVDTSIELPWWTKLSPTPAGVWAHARQPVTHDGRTELWHTRLAVRTNGQIDEAGQPFVRAVWAVDKTTKSYLDNDTPSGSYNKTALPFVPADGFPFRMAYDPGDRLDLIRNTADWRDWNPDGPIAPIGGGDGSPPALRADRLMLTSLGAYADLDGNWNSDLTSLVAWKQRTTLGRDHTVRITRRGYLLPFGHRCVQVELTERKFGNLAGSRGAYLFLRVFLVITEPVKRYPSAYGVKHGGRGTPFESIEVITRQSRDVASKQKYVGDPPIDSESVYFPKDSAGDLITLDFVGIDWEGQRDAFQAPFVFVEDKPSNAQPPEMPDPEDPATRIIERQPYRADDMQKITGWYNSFVPEFRTGTFSGQNVAFAPASAPGNTRLNLQSILFTAVDSPLSDPAAAFLSRSQMRAYPGVQTASVKISVADQLAGTGTPAREVAFTPTYLTHGFSPSQNAGEAFVEFTDGAEKLTFDTSKAGGLVTPTSPLKAVTRRLGPVGGTLAQIEADEYKPLDVFPSGTESQILGGVALRGIIGQVTGVRNNLDKVVRYTEERTPDEIIVRYRWVPDLQADPNGIFLPRTSDPKATARFEGEARQSVTDPARRSERSYGEITNFRLQLLGSAAKFILVDISKLSFRAASGQKTDVDVQVEQVTFDGPLRFVDELRKFLPGGGDYGVEVKSNAIVASTGFAIPSVQLGLFALSNLSFGASVIIPLTGKPVRVGFTFASEEDPFRLQISFFGGGGWFGIDLGADGMEKCWIGFEFGGALAIDVGVASGSISLMAGFFICLSRKSGGLDIEFEGFVRLHGEVQALGIVSISITLELGLKYLRKAGPPVLEIVTGRAKLEIKIQILFICIPISVEIEKSFGGNPSDPTFADQFSSSDWTDYAGAFGAVV